jgi:hypothetical protein
MIKNRKLETIIKGPAGELANWDRKIPKIAERIPKKGAKILNVFKLLLKFLADAAGKAVKPATSNPPTNFTPNATIAEIERR